MNATQVFPVRNPQLIQSSVCPHLAIGIASYSIQSVCPENEKVQFFKYLPSDAAMLQTELLAGQV